MPGNEKFSISTGSRLRCLRLSHFPSHQTALGELSLIYIMLCTVLLFLCVPRRRGPHLKPIGSAHQLKQILLLSLPYGATTNATITIMSSVMTVITKNFIVIPELNRVRTILCQKHDTISFFAVTCNAVLCKCISGLIGFIVCHEFVITSHFYSYDANRTLGLIVSQRCGFKICIKIIYLKPSRNAF